MFFLFRRKQVETDKHRKTSAVHYMTAINLLHLLNYHKESNELLYFYSTPGFKLTEYLINSVLQSLNLYENMHVEFQEIHLQDDLILTLTDGEYSRTAVISKNSPSVDMQVKIARFIDLFEAEFKNKIPKRLKDIEISTISRLIDPTFADQLIEECFEKSLTFPHLAHRPDENQDLNTDENLLHKLAFTLNEQSGPFLLGRLLSKAQMQTKITDTSHLIELIFILREKGALKPLNPKEVDGYRDRMLREKAGLAGNPPKSA
ncbi:MAG: hypothetical protein EU536_03735 [Promethearchaeota archaeon]|nr:MAG: hypothetical protein EU536_03735 [Candidatus Lokiarchaeota archaeon]